MPRAEWPLSSDSSAGCNKFDLSDYANIWQLPYVVDTPVPGLYNLADSDVVFNWADSRLNELVGFSNLQFSHNPATLGQQLQDLQDAYRRTLDIRDGCLDSDVYIDPAGPSRWETFGPYQCVGFNSLFPFCEETQPQSQDVPVRRRPSFYSVLVALFAQRVARKLHRKILLAQKLLRKVTTTFCGINWKKRVWFILHGGHPPKPDLGQPTDLMFGCAS